MLKRSKIYIFTNYTKIFVTQKLLRAEGEGGQRGRHTPPHTLPPPPHTPFPEAKFFSHVKSEHVKFLHVKHISDLSLLIEHDISDKK